MPGSSANSEDDMTRTQGTIRNVVAGLVVTLGCFWLGRCEGLRDVPALQAKHDRDLVPILIGQDRAFMKNVTTQPSALASGTYVLETTFPGKPIETCEVKLSIANGQLVAVNQAIGQPLLTDGFVQEGSIVRATVYDTEEGPPREYVGLIDRTTIVGKVYILPGQGWHEGEPAEYGVWRMYPKPSTP
jgi:hypothetical protein